MMNLIACFIICNSKRGEIPDETQFSDLRHPEAKYAIHAFSQWQYAYHCALALKAVLNSSVTVFPPTKLYDDRLALFLACKKGNIENKIKEYAPQKIRLYESLINLVISSPSPPTAAVIPTQNRFECLQELEQ